MCVTIIININTKWGHIAMPVIPILVLTFNMLKFCFQFLKDSTIWTDRESKVNDLEVRLLFTRKNV